MIHGNGILRTKKALKDLAAMGDMSLEFHFTDPSMFGRPTMRNLEGVAVVGPEAYNRKWWAQVWTDENGIVTKVT